MYCARCCGKQVTPYNAQAYQPVNRKVFQTESQQSDREIGQGKD